MHHYRVQLANLELKQCPDVNVLLSSMIRSISSVSKHRAAICKLREVVRLSTCISMSRRLARLAEASGNETLVTLSGVLVNPTVARVEAHLGRLIDPHASIGDNTNTITDYQLCHVLSGDCASGGGGLLEVARKTLQETTGDIIEYVKVLSPSEDGSIGVRFTNAHKFILHIKDAKVAEGGHYIRIGSAPSGSCYTTVQLIKLNERISESMEEIIALSEQYARQPHHELARRAP